MLVTIACGTTDTRSTKGNTDTTKAQPLVLANSPGNDEMEKGMKMEGKDHSKEEKARIDSPPVSLKAPLRPLDGQRAKTTKKEPIGLIEQMQLLLRKVRDLLVAVLPLRAIR